MIELRDYQRKAIHNMKNGCILCGGTGAGKSRTALAYYYIQNGGDLDARDYKRMVDSPKDLYIITTARKRDEKDWIGEMVPFLLTPNKDLKIYDHNIVVDSWNNIKKYKDIEGAFFIFDEDRVTGSGPWVDSFIKITRHNDWIILSATPGDKFEEYIPVFIANGFYKNKTEFEDKHIIYKWIPHANYKVVKGYINSRKLYRLRESILVDMDFDRPTTAYHNDVWVDYDKEMYKFITKNRWDPWKDKPIKNASEYCYALRRLTNTDPSREVEILEIFEKRHRLIIFYNFDYELEILRNLAENEKDINPKKDFEYAEWNGHLHQAVPNSEYWMYFVQYNAGSEAWNCITTDTIIFYSQSYSYKTMVQAAGRIDRMNTPYRDLYYYHLKSHSPIDIGIAKALKNKKKFNESRFVGGIL